ncbi:MAG: hypothetical protein WC592_03540 [Candidatus Omnitrophota bacterium]|nr:hypothetical protein [Candidatus Omnitrophota bacterium]
MCILNRAVCFAAIMVTIAITVYIFFGPLAVYIFSKANNLDISYTSLSVSSGKFAFGSLNAADRKTGIGISSKDARITPLWRGFPAKGGGAIFRLKDVNFTNRSPGKLASFDSLEGLIAIPFDSRWSYQEISGKVRSRKDGVDIENFSATSDEIKFEVSGSVDYDNAINIDIKVFFGGKPLEKIPRELTGALLTDEKDGWKSLAVRLSGDYKSPSINISSKLFRLNINTISR